MKKIRGLYCYPWGFKGGDYILHRGSLLLKRKIELDGSREGSKYHKLTIEDDMCSIYYKNKLIGKFNPILNKIIELCPYTPQKYINYVGEYFDVEIEYVRGEE